MPATVFEVATGDELSRIWKEEDVLRNGAAFSSDGRHLITLGSLPGSEESDPRIRRRQQGRVVIWDWREGKRIGEPLVTPSMALDAAYSPQGDLAVVVCAGERYFSSSRASQRIRNRMSANSEVPW